MIIFMRLCYFQAREVIRDATTTHGTANKTRDIASASRIGCNRNKVYRVKFAFSQGWPSIHLQESGTFGEQHASMYLQLLGGMYI